MNRVQLPGAYLTILCSGALAQTPVAPDKTAAVELKLSSAQLEQLMKSNELKNRSANGRLDMEIASPYKIDLGGLRGNCTNCTGVDPLPAPVPITLPPCPKGQKDVLSADAMKPYVFTVQDRSDKVADALSRAARINARASGAEGDQSSGVTVRLKNLSKADAEALARQLIATCPQCTGVDPLPTPSPITWPPKCPKK